MTSFAQSSTTEHYLICKECTEQIANSITKVSMNLSKQDVSKNSSRFYKD